MHVPRLNISISLSTPPFSPPDNLIQFHQSSCAQFRVYSSANIARWRPYLRRNVSKQRDDETTTTTLACTATQLVACGGTSLSISLSRALLRVFVLRVLCYVVAVFAHRMRMRSASARQADHLPQIQRRRTQNVIHASGVHFARICILHITYTICMYVVYVMCGVHLDSALRSCVHSLLTTSHRQT